MGRVWRLLKGTLVYENILRKQLKTKLNVRKVALISRYRKLNSSRLGPAYAADSYLFKVERVKHQKIIFLALSCKL